MPARALGIVALLALAALLPAAMPPAAAETAGATVADTDINMVVALDRSESVDYAARARQVESLAAALTDPRFVAAVQAGWNGRIGLAVMTWSSFERTHVVVPWTAIGSREDAAAVAAVMHGYEAIGADAGHKPQTDVSLALRAGVRMLRAAPFPTTRRIINVIGDGIDNFGADAFIDRDLAVAEDITINGLVHARGAAIPVVIRFFEAQVIGGPSAFVIPAPTPDSFAVAMLRKMLMEIAGAALPDRAAGPAVFRDANDPRGRG